MPQADISGLPPGARVVPGEPPVQRQIPLPRKAELNGNAKPQLGRHLPVGNALLGRVLDGAGRPLDGLGPLTGAELAPLSANRSIRCRVPRSTPCSIPACAPSTACSPSAAASAWACSPAPAWARACCWA